MKLFFVYFIMFFVIIHNSDSQTEDKQDNFNTILTFSSGLYLGGLSGSFFEVYNDVLEGKKESMDFTPNLSASMKFVLTKQYRMGALVEFFNTELSDSYEQKFNSSEGKATRYISQDFKQSIFPVFLTTEIVPYTENQFKSFYGIGIGVTISNLLWYESINSNFPADLRQGGRMYDNTYFSPAIRLYAAVELGFDRNPYSTFLGSLILELRYTQIFSNIDIFEKLRKQFIEIPPALNEYQSLVNSYFSLNLAISLNLLLEKNKNKK